MSSVKQSRVTARKALCCFAFVLAANILAVSKLAAQQTVAVNPGQNLQALVNQYPTGTTFSLAPGIHRLQSVVPKSYDSFIGQTGAILSGAALLTSFNQTGSYW